MTQDDKRPEALPEKQAAINNDNNNSDEERKKTKAADDMGKNHYLWPPMPDNKLVAGSPQQYGSQWRQISILVYSEQIDATEDEIKSVREQLSIGNPSIPDESDVRLEILMRRIAQLDRNKYYACGIIHNRDGHVSKGKYYTAYIDKHHAHITVWTPPGLGDKRYRVGQIINDLQLTFPMPENEWHVLNGGFAAVRDLVGSLMYQLHETQQAILEGKEHYERSERRSNLSSEELDEITRGYSLYHNRYKPTAEDWNNLAKLAAQEGKRDFEKCPALPLEEAFDRWKVRASGEFIQFRNKAQWSRLESEYKTAWKLARADWEHKRKSRTDNTIDRACIFIQGVPNAGKSESSFRAIMAILGDRYPAMLPDSLESMIVDVTNSKNGNLDSVDVYTEAIILNDCWVDDLLGLAEQKAVTIYRRVRGSPMFCGDFLVITSNLSLHDYLRARYGFTDTAIEALKSRFACAHLQGTKIVLDNMPYRGNDDKQARINDKVSRFVVEYRKTSNAYWGIDNEHTADAVLEEDEPLGKGDWQQESLDGFMNIPDGIDEELPFQEIL